MQESPLRKTQQRLWLALLNRAFFTPQNAIIIALCLILFAVGLAPFSWWAAPFWLIFGALGVAAFTAATLTDKKAQRELLMQLMREHYDPRALKNDHARQSLEKALEYYEAIHSLTDKRSGASKVEFEQVVSDIERLVALVFSLGQRVDEFEEDKIIDRDRQKAREELKLLEKRLLAESDPGVQEEVQRSIDFKKIQLENLMSRENNIKRADIQIGTTLTQLGTIYAQLQNIDSKALDRGSAKRLQGEVHDLVMGLQDTIEAIDEVQASRT
jgi:hypothetical protein